MTLTQDQIAWLQRNKAMSGGSVVASPSLVPSPSPVFSPSSASSPSPVSSQAAPAAGSNPYEGRFKIAVTDNGNKKYTIIGSGFQQNEAEIEVVPVDTVTFDGIHVTATLDQKGSFSKQIEINLLPRDKVKIYAWSKWISGISNEVVVTAKPDPNDTTPADRNPNITVTEDKDRHLIINGTGFTRVAEVKITILVIKSEWVEGRTEETARVAPLGTFTFTTKEQFHPKAEYSVQAVSTHDSKIVSNTAIMKMADDPNDPNPGGYQLGTLGNEDYSATYDAALQATSSRFSDPREAAEFAQAIAEEADRSSSKRHKELRAEFDPNLEYKNYNRYFNDAIQGLAAGKDTVGEIVKKAHAMAMAAIRAQQKKTERLDWLQVKLPQPMAPDCKPVSGKVHGPPNHMLCATHGHVIDIKTKMVIAHNITEYDEMHSKGAPR